jgi:hypothetical protein
VRPGISWQYRGGVRLFLKTLRMPLRANHTTSGTLQFWRSAASAALRNTYHSVGRRRWAELAIAVALPLFATGTLAAGRDAPVLIELFTAEGCSSCPPADHFLEQLDAAQPVRGANLIVLSEHVDYWDQQGWPDPYASKAFTERQRAYERSLKIHEPFTPQFIVDGTIDMRLSHRERISDQLHAAAAVTKVPVSIESLRVETGASPAISGVVNTEAVPGHRACELFVGVALDHVESQVLRGENRGQHLTHVGVLRELERVGTVAPNSTVHQPFSLALHAGLDNTRLRVLVFLQEPGPGAILGAAEETVGP